MPSRNACTPQPNEESDATVVAKLEHQGWTIIDGFLPPADCAALAAECRQLDADGALTVAATGHNRATSALRGDRTRWLEPMALSAPQARYWQVMDNLRVTLNRHLLLGLDHLEAHYAMYAPGSRYARHLDRLQGSSARVVSAVLYLNADWPADAGGELRLYLPGDQQRDVAPAAGRLVLFLSAEFEHEVLTATRERLSIAGWFRRRMP